jgi:adenylate cyclase
MPGDELTVRFGDEALAAAIAAAGNVILNGALEEQLDGSISHLNVPIAPLRTAMAAFGISNIQPARGDGVVHALVPFDKHPSEDNTALYSWPLVTAAYTLDPAFQLESRWEAASNSSQIVSPGNRVLPLNADPALDGGRMFINFRGGAGTFDSVPLLKIINGDYEQESGFSGYQNKIILIGATSASLKDVFNTPFDEAQASTPGVEVMANAIETVLTGEYLSRPPLTVTLVVILLAGVAAWVLTTLRQITAAIGALLGVMLAYALVWLGAFVFFRVQLPIVTPELTLVVAYVVPTLERAVSEELEKRRVRDLFALFISPEMVSQLIDQGVEAMRGKRTELTILFSDIRGFTTMSEKLTPEELVNLLNEYLGVMTDVIHKHGGTVDKYEGDLVMAFFGAPIAHPDHAQRAVRASIEMRQELDRLRRKWADEGKPSKLEMGIGLNTAEVFVGLVGSGRRVNYTVMGDGVNLASRLQDLTKDLQWPLLIGEATYAKIQADFDAEFGDARLVKGKTVPVNIYKVLGEKGAPPEKRVRALYE